MRVETKRRRAGPTRVARHRWRGGRRAGGRLASQPLVREYLGGGDYLVEGVEFQMGGEWYVEFTITQSEVVDTIRFDFDLPE
jgi:hypothetical protein